MPKKLLSVPHHKQQAESDCLAACAVMLLQSIDIQVPYPRLLSILDVKPWGTPHRNILKLAEIGQNVQVIYKQGNITDLFRTVDKEQTAVRYLLLMLRTHEDFTLTPALSLKGEGVSVPSP